MINDYAEKLKGSRIPLLVLYVKPGTILKDSALQYINKNYPNATVQYIGKGKHFIPEEHPKLVGQSIDRWIDTWL
jgi:pimeloyl-ACP methyl ester carboxylesterase